MTTGSGTQGSGSIVKAAGIAVFAMSIAGFSGTSNSYPSLATPDRTSSTLQQVGQVNKLANGAVASTASAVMEIRQMADLTWDETAKMFGVSRRTAHLWAGGRHPSAEQERRINRLHGVLMPLSERFPPSSLRQQLMKSAQPGTLYFDLLCTDKLDDFISLFVFEGGAIAAVRPSAQGQALGRYEPPPPTSLMGALQDRPLANGKAVSTKSVRLGRSTG
jgi:DNA-binding transcriptional regulator YiaG